LAPTQAKALESAITLPVVPALPALVTVSVMYDDSGVTGFDAVGALLPLILVATTEKVYGVELVKPVMITGLPATFADMLSGEEVTV
jgi:hypothetical protein